MIKFKLSKKLEGQNSQIETLIENIKYKELICSSFNELIIIFIGLETFIIKYKLNNKCLRSLYLLNEHTLIGDGYHSIYLINMNNYEIIRNIQFIEKG